MARPTSRRSSPPRWSTRNTSRRPIAEIDFTALAAMPALVEQSLSYAQAERLISIAAWPCALVEDASASQRDS